MVDPTQSERQFLAKAIQLGYTAPPYAPPSLGYYDETGRMRTRRGVYNARADFYKSVYGAIAWLRREGISLPIPPSLIHNKGG